MGTIVFGWGIKLGYNYPVWQKYWLDSGGIPVPILGTLGEIRAIVQGVLSW